MNINKTNLTVRAGALLLSAALLAACGGQNNAQQAGGPGAPTVGVVTVRTESVPLVTELPGRTTPYLIAEVRPQVSGIVKTRAFREGSEVKAGDLLYQIDPSVYQAAYDSAKAALARAEANLAVARVKRDRHAELVRIEAVSKQANDDAVAAYQQAHADVASAKAEVERARIDLGFTRVTSPIPGRIGRSAVTPGALVTANQAEQLATVQQLDPIYVDLTQSSAELLRLRRELTSGKVQKSAAGEVPVQLVLEDGSVYGAEGKLEFSEVSVDESTGSVTLRARFPNSGGELLPGMYVRARLAQGVKDDAILVPHAGVSRDARGNAMVMVVGADDKVESRVVKAERSLGDRWLVTEGLAAGDRVIVEGLQKIRPGAQVVAQQVEAVSTISAAAASAPMAN